MSQWCAEQVRGYGLSGDAHHITQPPEDGGGAALAVRRALADAALRPADIAYVNAHATGAGPHLVGVLQVWLLHVSSACHGSGCFAPSQCHGLSCHGKLVGGRCMMRRGMVCMSPWCRHRPGDSAC